MVDRKVKEPSALYSAERQATMARRIGASNENIRGELREWLAMVAPSRATSEVVSGHIDALTEILIMRGEGLYVTPRSR